MKFGILCVGFKGFHFLNKIIKLPKIVVSYKQSKSDQYFKKIQEFCVEKDIKFHETKSVDGKYFIDECDKFFVIGWQFLIKQNLKKYIVFHDSILPEFKGWSPTVNYLISGKPYIGMTAFYPTMKVDTGKILDQKKISISYPIKIQKALEIIAESYADSYHKIINGNFEETNMLGAETFCVWRNEDDYFIDWNDSSSYISRFVDATGFPYDNAKFKKDDYIFKLKDASEIENMNIVDRKKHIGKCIKFDNNKPVIICGNGLLRLDSFENIERKIEIKLKTKLT